LHPQPPMIAPLHSERSRADQYDGQRNQPSHHRKRDGKRYEERPDQHRGPPGHTGSMKSVEHPESDSVRDKCRGKNQRDDVSCGQNDGYGIPITVISRIAITIGTAISTTTPARSDNSGRVRSVSATRLNHMGAT
jgi:hypothetical protein